MSRPSEPVDTVSTSIDLLFLPSRMIEPLPKLRSICESAASRAFDLSIEEPSTRRKAAGAIAPTPYDRDSGDRQRTVRLRRPCTLFVLSSQYVLLGGATLAQVQLLSNNAFDDGRLKLASLGRFGVRRRDRPVFLIGSFCTATMRAFHRSASVQMPDCNPPSGFRPFFWDGLPARGFIRSRSNSHGEPR